MTARSTSPSPRRTVTRGEAWGAIGLGLVLLLAFGAVAVDGDRGGLLQLVAVVGVLGAVWLIGSGVRDLRTLRRR